MRIYLKTILIIPLVLIYYIGSSFSMEQQNTPSLEQIDFADGLFQRGMYDMAIMEYKRFKELYPNDANIILAYFGIAESYYFSESYKEAFNEYSMFANAFPDNDNAALSRVRIGQCLFFMKEDQRAVDHFYSLPIDAYPDELKRTCYFYIGKALINITRKDEAAAIFERVIALSGNDEYIIRAYLELGEILADNNEYSRAFSSFENAYKAASSSEMKILALYRMAQMKFVDAKYIDAAVLFKQIIVEYPNVDITPQALSSFLLSLFKADNFSDVIKEFENNRTIIKEREEYFDLFFLAACAYSELSEFEDSILILDKLIISDWRSYANLQKALLKKAEVLMKMKDFEKALLISQASELKDFKEKDRVLFLEAEILYSLEKYDEAVENFNEILKRFPDSQLYDDSLYSMAYAYKEAGKCENAVEFFFKYFNEGIDSGKRQKALYSVILMNMKLSQTQSAIQNSCLFLDTFTSSDLREKVIFMLGSLYSNLKEYNKASDIYSDFVDKYSNSERLDEAYFLLGYNLQLADRNKEALSSYEKVGKKNYQGIYFSALKNRAIICFSLNKEDETAVIYRQIIEEMPDCDLEIGAYMWLAKYYLNNKKYDDALVMLGMAEKKEDIDSRIAEANYFKGEVYRETNRYEKAIENYNLALSETERQIYYGAAHIGKGLCLIELAKLDEGKKEFETAILENVDDNTITMRSRFELANIAFKKEEFEEASKLYMLVAILYDDKEYCPRALFKAGESFKACGRIDEAKKAFEELMVRFKKNELVNKAKSALSAIENKKV